MEKIDQIGFDIGWDHAVYGVVLPEDAQSGPVYDGFRAACMKGYKVGGGNDVDRFVRKWLQLRRNAWKRRRVFNTDVTPEFIRSIMTNFCPVSRVELTFGTGAETDWSVDRVNNDVGYVRGNLIVMSARANIIKDRLSISDFERVIKEADIETLLRLTHTMNTSTMEPPTMDEFIRILSIVAIGSHRGGSWYSPAVTPRRGLPTNLGQMLLSRVSSGVTNYYKKRTYLDLLKRIDPSPNGIHRIGREIRNVINEHYADRFNEVYDLSLALGSNTHNSVTSRVMWIAEDVWLPQHRVMEMALKWLEKTPLNRIEFIARQLGIATDHRLLTHPPVESEGNGYIED